MRIPTAKEIIVRLKNKQHLSIYLTQSINQYRQEKRFDYRQRQTFRDETRITYHRERDQDVSRLEIKNTLRCKFLLLFVSLANNVFTKGLKAILCMTTVQSQS